MDSTPICGYDTIRLTFPLEKRPSDCEWYGFSDAAPKRPPAPSDNPCLPQLKLTGLEDSPYGGWFASCRNGYTSKTLWRQQDGVHYEYQESQWGSYGAVECSLPKLVNGHNKVPLLPSELPGAFDALHWRVKSFLSHAPQVLTMDVWRVDATLDTRLGGELELAQVARLLSDMPLNDVLPVRYPSGGSLRWVKGKGAGRPVYRCYSKSVESYDEAIAGQYRAEAQVAGAKALAFALKQGDLSLDALPGSVGKYPRPQSLIEVETLPTALVGPLAGVLGCCVGYAKGLGAMTSMQAIDLLINRGGATRSRAVQLVGYAHVIRVAGWEGTGLTRKGRWEAEKVFDAAGVDPKLVDFSAVERVAVCGVAGLAVAGPAGLAGGALFAAGTVIGDKLVDAGEKLVDAVRGSDKPVKRRRAPAGELGNVTEKVA